MAHLGKIQLTIVISSPPELAEEGDRLFRSHAPWMQATHHRDGEKALLEYNVSKSPELSNPLDPASAPTGRVCFVLNEVYVSQAGVADHFEQAQAGWKEFPAFMEWLGMCKVTTVTSSKIFNSLW